jgi:hypothetical protein
MKPYNWIKQPSESRILEIDCANTLPTGVTVTAVSAYMYDLAETDVSSSMIDGIPTISGNSVYVQIKGGTTGYNYDCKVVLTLSNGEIAEDDITVQVKDTKVVRR